MAKTIKSVMRGATAEYRERLQQSTDTATYDEVLGLAREILVATVKVQNRGSDPFRVGSMSAALMLAATAFGEYGVAAQQALVIEAQRDRPGFRKAKKKTKKERGVR